MCNQGQTDFGSQKNGRAVDQVEVPHSILDKLKTRWECKRQRRVVIVTQFLKFKST